MTIDRSAAGELTCSILYRHSHYTFDSTITVFAAGVPVWPVSAIRYRCFDRLYTLPRSFLLITAWHVRMAEVRTEQMQLFGSVEFAVIYPQTLKTS